VRDGARVQIIPVQKLDAIEAQDGCVAWKTGARSVLEARTLRFVRAHRSHLVRIDALARIEPFDSARHIGILPDGSPIPLSREGSARWKESPG